MNSCNTMGLVLAQIVAMYGALDLKTAVTLKACCKDLHTYMTNQFMDIVIVKDDPVFWLATIVGQPMDIASVCKLKERASHGDPYLISRAIPNTIMDTGSHDRIIDLCFRFDTHASPDTAFNLFVREFLSVCISVNHEERTTSYSLFLKICTKAFEWSIRNQKTIKCEEYPTMTDKRLLQSMKTYVLRNKELIHTVVCPKGCPNRCLKLLRAWKWHLLTGREVFLGKNGGIYRLSKDLHRRYYW